MVCDRGKLLKFFFADRYWKPVNIGEQTVGRYEKNIHLDLAEEFEIWRLILEKIVTLTELETTWNLDDVMRANALLDMRLDLAEDARRRAK